MNEIEKAEKYYYIIYHDGSKKLLLEEQALFLSRAMDNPNNRFANIGDDKIAINSISKILSIEEYRREYPDVENQRVVFNKFPRDPFENETTEEKELRHARGLEEMRVGFFKETQKEIKK